MFKKTEESEWTRFSRALQSQPAHPEPQVEPDDDDTVEVPAAGRSDAPESLRDDAPPPAYARVEPAYSRAEPAYARVEPAYADPAYADPAYAEPEPAYEPTPALAYAEPAPLSPPAPPVAPIADPVDSAETVLGEGASFEGTLRSDRSVRVRGFLAGEIESRERVIVEGTARVEARIVAEQVMVIGEVNGQITCAGRVEIAPTGRVTGEVTTGRLAIQEGAFFQGQLTMVPNQAGAVDEGAVSGDVLDDGSAG